MRKRKLVFACVILLSGTMLFSSCVGSFNLFNRLSSWNQTIDNKFVNELVFIALWIVPVYEAAFIADIFVTNSIEFWSKDNPAAKAGDLKTVKGKNGDYLVETLENGYSISYESKEAELIFNSDNNTWNVVVEGEVTELVKLNNDGTAQLYLPNGESMNVTLDAEGIMAAREAVINDTYFAAGY